MGLSSQSQMSTAVPGPLPGPACNYSRTMGGTQEPRSFRGAHCSDVDCKIQTPCLSEPWEKSSADRKTSSERSVWRPKITQPRNSRVDLQNVLPALPNDQSSWLPQPSKMELVPHRQGDSGSVRVVWHSHASLERPSGCSREHMGAADHPIS